MEICFEMNYQCQQVKPDYTAYTLE